MSDALPTREEIAEITSRYCDSVSHGATRLNPYTQCGRCKEETDTLLARLRPAWERLEQQAQEERLKGNFDAEVLHQELDALRAEQRETSVKIVQAEEEMDGSMPDTIWNACVTRDGCAEVLRAAVRVTKRNIIAAIRAQGETR